jgi:hypothetical protein
LTDPVKYEQQRIERDNKAEKRPSSKMDHAKNFIRYTARYLGEYGAGADIIHILMLPYETGIELYEEYITHYVRSIRRVFVAFFFILYFLN